MANEVQKETRTTSWSVYICREILSARSYIFADDRLGLKVDPVDVRLITGDDIPYKWSCIPEKRYLFRKQLSKLNIREYVELYHLIEKEDAIEAVPANHQGEFVLSAPISSGRPVEFNPLAILDAESDQSFTGHITRLSAEKQNLQEELAQLNGYFEATGIARDKAEGDLLQAREVIEKLRRDLGEIRPKLIRLGKLARYYYGRARFSDQALSRMISVAKETDRAQHTVLSRAFRVRKA
ncbi:hypothetical protein UCRPC4_g03309 [Phaeomoniella chlamydospora]|uniref:Uncharacterized protein n=1 Tax=Phaeomoniella chlamydospora TaxID=158046 RepID=A0A0G2EJ95_PHACM|nr:hypothetical protein UCRPC4_g03309 [Phaeomoniella chlamydospora]